MTCSQSQPYIYTYVHRIIKIKKFSEQLTHILWHHFRAKGGSVQEDKKRMKKIRLINDIKNDIRYTFYRVPSVLYRIIVGWGTMRWGIRLMVKLLIF